ncbi:MAG: molybdopterin oxidoreductase [Bdellovibrionota bacterium]|nr:molybdopterin oxidoreductase [Bdellovibrionota bacterium]
MAQDINVPKYKMSPATKTVVWVCALVGLLTFLFGIYNNPERVWYSYLTSFFYFTSLSLCGLFFVAINHITSAGWSVNIRRVPEAFTAFLPYVLVGAIVLIIGADFIYPWLNPEIVAVDTLIQKKVSYLNEGFFIFRVIAFILLWLFFAKKIVGNSLKQDETGDVNLTHKNLALSVGFIVVFALSYSLFSVDTLMSVDPHWFSTIFGVYAFSGLFQSGLAMMILFILALKSGYLKSFINDDHVHDMGKFLFGFTIFYAYIAFSQYLLIWYANLPEETIFYIHRSHGGWEWVSLSLLFGKFIIPFLALAPAWAKKKPGHLKIVCVWILIMQYVDFYWLVYPNLHTNTNGMFPETPIFNFYEIGIFLGFLGLFLFAVNKFLEKNSLIPIKDPRLHESMHHHI